MGGRKIKTKTKNSMKKRRTKLQSESEVFGLILMMRDGLGMVGTVDSRMCECVVVFGNGAKALHECHVNTSSSPDSNKFD